MLQIQDTRTYHQTVASMARRPRPGEPGPELQATLLGRFSGRGGFSNRGCPRGTFVPHIIQGGEGVFETGGHAWRAVKGDLFVFFPDQAIHYYDLEGTPWRYTWLSLEGAGVAWALKCAGLAPENPFRKGTLDVELEPLFQEMEEAYRTEQHSALFPAVAGWRFVEALCPREERRTGAGTPQAIAESARFLLDRTFTQDVYVGDLAQRLGVTRSTLFRHFRSCYGRAPKQYLLSLRLDQAQRLLLQTSASVKEIAAACGFHSAHYLCRVFQRETGLSPRAWQRGNR